MAGAAANLPEATGSYFTLSFTIDFHTPHDTYLLAHTYPYTYSDHKHHLASLLASPRRRRYIKHCVLCPTLGGHDCDLLTITEDESAGERARRDGDARGGMGGSGERGERDGGVPIAHPPTGARR